VIHVLFDIDSEVLARKIFQKQLLLNIAKLHSVVNVCQRPDSLAARKKKREREKGREHLAH
jgi:hypothetical protein